MNTALDALFPSHPSMKGFWQAIYLSPIVGSGEKITIGVAAMVNEGDGKVIQAIRTELLECLYGSKSSNMQSMIAWVIESASKELKNKDSLEAWVPPVGGIETGPLSLAEDDSLNGILRQAVRFSSSLGTLSLDADRADEEEQPRRYSEQWTKSIHNQMKANGSDLAAEFNKKVKVSGASIMTTYGFLANNYVSNFGLLVPSRLSSSLSTVKAKLFDLESLQKSNLIVKPKNYEVIIGTPAFDDPTLSDKAVKKLKDTVQMISELANDENISVFRADNAQDAAKHLVEVAA